jgi:hypothetical protein
MRKTMLNVALFTTSALLVSGCQSNSVAGYFSPIPSSTSNSTSTSGGTVTPGPVGVTSPVPGPTMTAMPTPIPTITTHPINSPTPAPIVSVTPTATPTPSPSPSVPCTETCYLNNGVGTTSCGTEQTACILTQCNPGYVVDDGECVPVTSVSAFVCTSYEQLVLNTTTNELTTATGSVIPAQDPSGKGVCYYYPIVELSTPLSGSSYLNGTSAADHDQDVVARDHDVNTGSPTYDWHPYTMEHFNANLTIAGQRQLNVTGGSVSGTSFTKGDVAIDNFFLVGAYPQTANLSPGNLLSYYSAWGANDSTIVGGANDSLTGIAFNPAGLPITTDKTYTYPDKTTTPYSDAGLKTTVDYAMIPLNSEASGGTANVPEVSLTNLISPNMSTTVDFRALDCGAARSLNSIYLLVQ